MPKVCTSLPKQLWPCPTGRRRRRRRRRRRPSFCAAPSASSWTNPRPSATPAPEPPIPPPPIHPCSHSQPTIAPTWGAPGLSDRRHGRASRPPRVGGEELIGFDSARANRWDVGRRTADVSRNPGPVAGLEIPWQRARGHEDRDVAAHRSVTRMTTPLRGSASWITRAGGGHHHR